MEEKISSQSVLVYYVGEAACAQTHTHAHTYTHTNWMSRNSEDGFNYTTSHIYTHT